MFFYNLFFHSIVIRLGKKKKHTTRKMSIPKMILADYNDVAATFPSTMGLVEMEVTDAMARMKEIKEKENYNVSHTAWIAKCVATAVNENKIFNSFRKRRKIITFEDVDISIIVEITTKEGKKMPFNYVLRDVVHKSVRELTDEIRKAQQRKIEEVDTLTRDKKAPYSPLYALVPRFLRRFVIRTVLTNPFAITNLAGTVGITSLGMFAKSYDGWAIPFRDRTLSIAVGSTKEQPIIRNGELVNAKFLRLTLLFDHNLIDGAPAARFVNRLAELLKSAAYLQDLDEK